MRNCETCKFLADGDKPTANCRRVPPTVTNNGASSCYPLVRLFGYGCAEHRLSILRYLKSLRRRLGPLSD